MRQSPATNCLKLSQTLLNLGSSCAHTQTFKYILKYYSLPSFSRHHDSNCSYFCQQSLFPCSTKCCLLASLPAFGLEIGEQRPNLLEIFLGYNILFFEEGDSQCSKAKARAELYIKSQNISSPPFLLKVIQLRAVTQGRGELPS